MARMKLIFGLAVAALALSGCQLPEKYQQSDADLKRTYAKIAPPRPETPSVYCYKTLADPECLPVFLPGQEYRLLSYFGPAPYVIQITAPTQVIFQE